MPVRLIGARQLAVQLQRVVLAVQSPDAVRLLAFGPLRRAVAGRLETACQRLRDCRTHLQTFAQSKVLD